MAAILDKKQMTEEDIKLQYITPAILKKWDLGLITMETKITDGRILLGGNMAVRSKPKKADYVLYANKNKPIAIIEAKDNKHTIAFGMQQAMEYAIMLDVPFAFSSNGDGFLEHDFLTGKERYLGMDDFPDLDDLMTRWSEGANEGKGLSDAEKEAVKKGAKEGLESLIGKIPGLVDIKVNTVGLPSSNADMMLDSTFESAEALKGYSTHPEHVAVVDSIDGDYAHLKRTDVEMDDLKIVARALLPAEITVGSRLKYECMTYELM